MAGGRGVALPIPRFSVTRDKKIVLLEDMGNKHYWQ